MVKLMVEHRSDVDAWYVLLREARAFPLRWYLISWLCLELQRPTFVHLCVAQGEYLRRASAGLLTMFRGHCRSPMPTTAPSRTPRPLTLYLIQTCIHSLTCDTIHSFDRRRSIRNRIDK